ncbi:hypothetical protein Tco_0815546, partial [Tanacetum coccineum]
MPTKIELTLEQLQKGVSNDVLVKQKDDGIFINQDKYVAEILNKFDFSLVKTASTPIETNKALLKDEEAEDVDVHLYKSMIGSLMYLIASRPDIMFAVCAYVRDSPFDLEAFLDSDYARASLDRKSTTGGCQFLGKRLISWQCKSNRLKLINSTIEARSGEDNMERAATTASSLEAEQDSGAKIPYWGVQKLKLGLRLHLNKSNDPSLSRVNTLRSGEDSMKLKELMELCTKLSERILDNKNR